uniref:Peptidyl-prolyl cis-trans isomerase CYP38-like PsbQ-like domain-containing protein n=1 Tax=Rhizophora mucronata TaxID=61149 RepID=A0A2P2K9Z2_RHIMU
MALTLSSASTFISHNKLSSFNVCFTSSSIQNRPVLSTHCFGWRFNGGSGRGGAHLKTQCCRSAESNAKGMSNGHGLADMQMSTIGHGWKTLQSLIAAILVFVEISSPLTWKSWNFWSISPAKAVLYSPDTKVPRTGELALRRAIPANTNMKKIQTSLEDISYLLRIPQRKPYGTMEGNVKKALKVCTFSFDTAR